MKTRIDEHDRNVALDRPQHVGDGYAFVLEGTRQDGVVAVARGRPFEDLFGGRRLESIVNFIEFAL
jgi:hypothetical protein